MDQSKQCVSEGLFLNRDAFLAALRRSTVTSRVVDTVEKLGTTILTVPVEHAAARASLRGETGVAALNDYRGVPVLMAYGPVDLDSLRWGIIAKIDEAEAMAPLGDYARRVLTWGVGLSLLRHTYGVAAGQGPDAAHQFACLTADISRPG